LYDWRMGLPIVEPCAARDYDLAAFYREQGLEVLELETGTHTGYGPLMMNNCVGHAKLLIGASSFALVPNGLYQHFTRGSIMNKLISYVRRLSFVPGFGGGSTPAPPPPPPAPEPVSRKADKDVQTARRDEMKRARLAAGMGGSNKTGAFSSDAATTTKTMLG